VDRRGLAAVDAVAVTARIYSPWECAGLDLRRYDSTLAGSTDLRRAGIEAQQTLHIPDPPDFLWHADTKRVSACTMVALERGLALGDLTPDQQKHLLVEGRAREMVWDVISGLHLPVHVYQDVRQRIHDRPMEAFEVNLRRQSFLVGPNGRTPLREAVDEAIAHPRSWIAVPEMPAPVVEAPMSGEDLVGDFLRRMQEGFEEDEDDFNPNLRPHKAPEKPAAQAPGVPQEVPKVAPVPIPTLEPAPPTPRRKMRH